MCWAAPGTRSGREAPPASGAKRAGDPGRGGPAGGVAVSHTTASRAPVAYTCDQQGEQTLARSKMAATNRPLSSSRRRFVQGAGLAGMALLAGCGRLPGQAPPAKAHRIGYLSPQSLAVT